MQSTAPRGSGYICITVLPRSFDSAALRYAPLRMTYCYTFPVLVLLFCCIKLRGVREAAPYGCAKNRGGFLVMIGS